VCLHNYLHLTDNAKKTPAGFIDSVASTGNNLPGDWGNIGTDGNGGLNAIGHIGGK